MRSLDIPDGRLNGALDLLVRAGHILTSSTDVADSLTQISALCASGFADFCSISVIIEALGRDEFAVTSGIQPEQPPVPSGRICEPLVAGRRVYGEIVCERSALDGFDDETRQAVRLLSIQLSIVIAGHAAARREHRVADRFQRALLPEHLPSVPGVCFHASYRPASDEADVGGDWYDSFFLSDGRVAISVGDVSGHGLDAAVIMGEVRQAIRTAAAGGAMPAELLEYVNGAIRLRHNIGMVTAMFGVYDPSSSVLTYAIGGHPAPVLSLSSGVTRLLPGGGLPLGCAPRVDAENWTFTIPAGSRVLFYTDGLIENDRSPIDGEERLLEVIRTLEWSSGSDPAQEVQQRVFGDAANRDDAAVLSLTRDAAVPHYVFSALPIVAPIARAIVERELERTNLPMDRRFGVLVAVGEAIANAVEHAYRGQVAGLLKLTIELDSRQLIVTIEDFGRWRPFVRREERGRGIELMHAFMDGVQIRSTRESTAIVLKADLKTSEDSQLLES